MKGLGAWRAVTWLPYKIAPGWILIITYFCSETYLHNWIGRLSDFSAYFFELNFAHIFLAHFLIIAIGCKKAY
jgi:hypothetical protein